MLGHQGNENAKKYFIFKTSQRYISVSGAELFKARAVPLCHHDYSIHADHSGTTRLCILCSSLD